jgi:hypothetical protein
MPFAITRLNEVRRSFRVIASTAGLDPKEWTPRELRHSFVSLLSSSGVTREAIAHLVSHGSASGTERVYRKELRPVITGGGQQSMSSSMGRQTLGRQFKTDPSAKHVGGN